MTSIPALYRSVLPYSLRLRLGRTRSLANAFRAAIWLRAYAWTRQSPIRALQYRPRRHYDGKDVVLVGFFNTRSGVGRGAELIARSLEAEGSTVTRVDIPLHPLHGIEKLNSSAILPKECEQIKTGRCDLVIIANPPNFSYALSLFSFEWLRSKTIIAHWVWELDVVDKEWWSAVKLCDEVWASSQFVANTLVPLCVSRSIPLKVVPYPVELDPFRPATSIERARIRRRLRIPEGVYTLGYSFSISSNYARKNPIGAIAAFRTAFASEPDVRLILRALDGHVYETGMAELRRTAAGDERIILVEHSELLPIRDFYAAIDLYVSPARAEGYGLNIVEAVQAGRPVLAVAWSLSDEVLNRPGVETSAYTLVPVSEQQGNYATVSGAHWAELDVNDMAKKIRTARRKFDESCPAVCPEPSEWIFRALDPAFRLSPLPASS